MALAGLAAKAALKASMTPQGRKKLAIIAGVGCGLLTVVVGVASILLMLAAGAVATLFGGGSSSVSVVTSASLSQLSQENASLNLTQIYPSTPVTSESPGDRQIYPIPSEAQLTSMLAIQTSYQTPLITKCYSTWAEPQPYGGMPCGFGGWPGQCTYWALLNWNNPAMLKLSGNADQFLSNAINMGLQTSATPVVGSIVVWGAGNGYSSNGHVAIVVAVNPQLNTFVVSEMNYYTPWMIDYRVVSSSPGGIGHGNLLGFILPIA